MECSICGKRMVFGRIECGIEYCDDCIANGLLHTFKCDACGERKSNDKRSDASLTSYKTYCIDCEYDLVKGHCDNCDTIFIDGIIFPKHKYCQICAEDIVDVCGYCDEDVDTHSNCSYGSDVYGNVFHFHTECYQYQKILFRKFDSENPQSEILFRKFEL